MIVLSGDIGGTTTRMQFTDFKDSGESKVIKRTYYNNSDYSSFIEVIDSFFAQTDLDQSCITGACFDVAGPVVCDVVRCTNLPWVIETDAIKKKLKMDKVALINDFVAIGYGLETLSAKDLLTLQVGKPVASGVKAYLGAGTGLGIGFTTYDQGIARVYPTEGGYVDFAPIDEIQLELLKFLRQKYHRVSFERLLSGPGLVNIYQFIRSYSEINIKENHHLAVLADGKRHIDLPAVIAEYATKHQDPLATYALNIFIRIYGAAAGNLALTTLPLGGLYIVGGIAPKLSSLINSNLFFDTFSDKGRMSNLIKEVPMHVVLCPEVGLQGAALYAKNISC